MTNAFDRRSLSRDPSKVVEVYSASDLPPPVPDPFGVMRVPLTAGATYVINEAFSLPRCSIPQVVTPGEFAVITFFAIRSVTLLIDGDDTPHIWGRRVSGLEFDRVSLIDISNGGAGRGTVLFDMVGGNGDLSVFGLGRANIVNFKKIARLVDVGTFLSDKTLDVNCASGWTFRGTAAVTGISHFITDRRFGADAALPDNASSSMSFIGDVPAVIIGTSGVILGKPANSFLHIDSGTSIGSYQVTGCDYRGTVDGTFFRPTLVAALTLQEDASVAVLSFADSAAAPGVDTTVSFASAIDINRGQVILIAGGTYAGVYAITRVALDQLSFDIAFVFAGASAGTLALTRHTVATNGYVRDETVTISGTTNYNGTAQIVRATDTTFTLPQVFAGNDATGTATSAGKDQTSIGVNCVGNGSLADSGTLAEVSWNANVATTTIADGTYGPLSLTGASIVNQERTVLNAAATGEITYVGKRPFKGRLVASIIFNKAGASLASYRVSLSVNQTPPVFDAGDRYTALDLREISVQAQFQAIVDLVEGDDIRLVIAGDATTTVVTAAHGTIILQD